MNNWFVCKIKYAKEDEYGRLKNVNEPYLVDAMSFTEAEARMYEELGTLIRGEMQVSSMSKANISEVFRYEDSDTWFKCKITYVITDGDSAMEKKVTNYFLVSAHDVKQAYERIYESLNNMLVSFEVPDVVKSPIVEVFEFIGSDEREAAVPKGFTPLSELQEKEIEE
ncbi:DUF4494 domain-containing protein [Shiella aurantiaca]|nr:DUF4494 domain-containing protein [Shiella aurantiaca]